MVFAALQRIRPPGIDLRRSGSLSLSDGFDFDFVLTDGTQTTVVETRSIRRELIGKDIQRMSVLSEDTARYPQATLLVVAKNGFSLSAYRWVSDNSEQLTHLRKIVLVKWDGEGNDRELSEALALSISE